MFQRAAHRDVTVSSVLHMIGWACSIVGVLVPVVLLSILARDGDEIVHVITGSEGVHHERASIQINIMVTVFGVFGRVALVHGAC